MTASYAFVTHWVLESPLEDVWEAIEQSEAWPTWWRDVKAVEVIAAGDEQGAGAVRRYTWRTALPYSFTFVTRTTRVERPHLLEAQASGDLEGLGLWRLSAADGQTRVRYDWQVRTNRPWMNLLAPIARPAFAWNHATVMRRGGQDLARHLGARLISAT